MYCVLLLSITKYRLFLALWLLPHSYATSTLHSLNTRCVLSILMYAQVGSSLAPYET